MSVKILTGDCRALLLGMADRSINCCVTSPPYFGLRDYGVDGQMGLEKTPEEFVSGMVNVFREVRRVLRDDGTLWLNIGDSYAGSWGAQSRGNAASDGSSTLSGGSMLSARQIAAHPKTTLTGRRGIGNGTKAKDLIGIPWMLAFALRSDGWYLRQDIIWSKPNPMPESVRDRCTKSHEYLFLLSKSDRYYFDASAIAEDVAPATIARLSQAGIESQAGSDRVPGKSNGPMKAKAPRFGGSKYGDNPNNPDHRTSGNEYTDTNAGRRNRRSVWSIATQPFKEAHFATFPPALVEPCIRAGCPIGGIVLDPFGGAGTTGLVADRLQRSAVLIELNPKYVELARNRISGDSPLLADVA